MVKSGSEHAFGGVTGQSDILVLNLPKPNNDDAALLARFHELNQADTYFQLDDHIQKLIQMLVTEMRANPDDPLLARACNSAVISLLQRHSFSYALKPKESRFDLDVLDRYIEQHLSHKITVAQLASSVFLGESQFHMLFKEQLGITPHQYVLGKRIDMAKSLINEGQLTLGQIAEFTGFSGQSTFAHAFSRHQGMSPSQYKKQNRVK